MKIHIDKEAEEYIESKSSDKAIHIFMKKVGGGWCASFEPSVQVGRPYSKDNFKVHRAGDIDVYIAPSVVGKKSGISIGLSKILWFTKLTIEGVIL